MLFVVLNYLIITGCSVVVQKMLLLLWGINVINNINTTIRSNTKEVYTEIDTQAPKQHVWMIMTNNTTTILGLKQHDFNKIYYYNNIPDYYYYVPSVMEQDFNSISYNGNAILPNQIFT